ncbi:MAG: hypothetical protein ABEH38_07345 [Flavobacteriales bacterium]
MRVLRILPAFSFSLLILSCWGGASKEESTKDRNENEKRTITESTANGSDSEMTKLEQQKEALERKKEELDRKLEKASGGKESFYVYKNAETGKKDTVPISRDSGRKMLDKYVGKDKWKRHEVFFE